MVIEKLLERRTIEFSPFLGPTVCKKNELLYTVPKRTKKQPNRLTPTITLNVPIILPIVIRSCLVLLCTQIQILQAQMLAPKHTCRDISLG